MVGLTLDTRARWVYNCLVDEELVLKVFVDWFKLIYPVFLIRGLRGCLILEIDFDNDRKSVKIKNALHAA